MLRLLKYEIKGKYKMTIAFIICIVLANFLALTQVYKNNYDDAAFISSQVFFITLIITYIINVESFYKDVYTNNGYLIFTIPLKGITIIGTKLIFAIIQLWVVTITAAIFFITYVMKCECSGYVVKCNYEGFFILILIYVFALLTAYLCIVIAKISIKNREIGTLTAFGLFILLMVVLNLVNSLISKWFPNTLSNSIDISVSSQYGSSFGFTFGNGNTEVFIFNSFLYMFILIITVYLMDKKMEL